VKPNLSFHLVCAEPDGLVTTIQDIQRTPMRINGGFFVLRQEIFKHLRDGEELVGEPFRRLVGLERLRAYEYDGFWMSMDTFKDRQQLEEIYARGQAPWEVWEAGVDARAPQTTHVIGGQPCLGQAVEERDAQVGYSVPSRSM
jgi:glucose-1-phosphate cytidylyltransferase